MRIFHTAYYILFLLLLASCAALKSDRNPAGTSGCRDNGIGCPFLVIGHRGAPLDEAENTIPAFAEALRQGANALEIDLVMTAEGEVAVYHDRNPNDLIGLIRQAGLEGQKYIPFNPGIGTEARVPTEQLTLDELRKFYGYALSKGIFGDIFTNNKKDPDAVIPTIEEFSEWANQQKNLEAVFLDIKLIPGQEKRAPFMAQKFAAAFAHSSYRVYMLTPHESIYGALQEWINQNPKARNRFLTLDMEEDGALNKRKTLRAKLKKKVRSLALGSTVLRSWDTYTKELHEVLDRARRKQDMVYPVVSWTVDNERKLYELLQMGVDGILTNRPNRLHRLLNRHWKDHSTAAKSLANCYQKAKQGPWQLCDTGNQIAPLGPIGQEEIRTWACSEKGVHPTLKDFYGCGGVFDKVNIKFNTKIEDDPKILMFTSPGGAVNVGKLNVTPTEKDQLVFIEYKQEKCNDGILNNKCEYELEVEFYLEGGNLPGNWKRMPWKYPFKDTMSLYFVIPKTAKKMRFILSETDDGKVDDTADVNGALYDGAVFNLQGPGKKFRGNMKVMLNDMAPWLAPKPDSHTVALEFFERSCNDGVLNYKCEYKMQVEVVAQDGTTKIMQGENQVMKGSFVVYATLPKDARGVKLTIFEMDEESVSARSDFYMELDHGASLDINPGDDTFYGEMKIKFVDYDEENENSESDSTNPHNQKNREKLKRYELSMP